MTKLKKLSNTDLASFIFSFQFHCIGNKKKTVDSHNVCLLTGLQAYPMKPFKTVDIWLSIQIIFMFFASILTRLSSNLVWHSLQYVQRRNTVLACNLDVRFPQSESDVVPVGILTVGCCRVSQNAHKIIRHTRTILEQ